MHHDRTTKFESDPIAHLDIAPIPIHFDIQSQIELELALWSITSDTRPSTERRVRQAREAAIWVDLWLRAFERADNGRTVDLAHLVTAAVEIVVTHWDDAAIMREVMWRRVLDAIDCGLLGIELALERALAQEAMKCVAP